MKIFVNIKILTIQKQTFVFETAYADSLIVLL